MTNEPEWTREAPSVAGVYEVRAIGAASEGMFSILPTGVMRGGRHVFTLNEMGKKDGPPTWWFEGYEWRGPLEVPA